jgi:hypothetical protein
MSEAVGYPEKLIWNIVCPRCGLDQDLGELGYKAVKVGDKIYQSCKCGCKIVKIVGKDVGIEIE